MMINDYQNEFLTISVIQYILSINRSPEAEERFCANEVMVVKPSVIIIIIIVWHRPVNLFDLDVVCITIVRWWWLVEDWYSEKLCCEANSKVRKLWIMLSILTRTEPFCYRAMLRRARLCHKSRPSVCLSVRGVELCFQTGWNSSKIISRPNSLRLLLRLTPIWGGIGVGSLHYLRNGAR